MMDEWQGLIAVKEEAELWALYFDINGESVSERVIDIATGACVLPILQTMDCFIF